MIWGRYAIRRFFRVWPPYAFIYAVGCIFHKYFVIASVGTRTVSTFEDWYEALTFQVAYAQFWTIRLEMAYYCIIPILVLSYVAILQLAATIDTRLNGAPFPSSPLHLTSPFLIAARFLALTVIALYACAHAYVVRTNVQLALDAEAGVFGAGSFAAFLFREFQREKWLLLSDAQVKQQQLQQQAANDQGSSLSSSSSSQSMEPSSSVSSSWVSSYVPSTNSALRFCMNILSVGAFLIIFSFIPHYKHELYGAQFRIAMVTPVLYTFFLFASLFAPDEWVQQIFSLSPLRSCGVWSFSIYLTHGIIFDEFANDAGDASDGIKDTAEVAWIYFDYFFMSLVLIIFLAIAFHHVVEKPSMNAGTWLINRYLPKVKKVGQ